MLSSFNAIRITEDLPVFLNHKTKVIGEDKNLIFSISSSLLKKSLLDSLDTGSKIIFYP